tara:strand:+ start:417 stop:641 length:225 start_codon:yes stop_codon:yes gene_type:complete
MNLPPASKDVRNFVEYFLDNVLEARKDELRDREALHDSYDTSGRLLEVIEMSIVLRDLLDPVIIPNNDQDDDGN